MASWDQTKAAALKILGKGGKLPKERVNISTALTKISKVFDAFDAGREDLEKKLVALQGAADEGKRAAHEYTNQIDTDDFGLDSKKDEDKPKIEQARKLLTDSLNKVSESADTVNQELDTLDRGLSDIRRLKDVKL